MKGRLPGVAVLQGLVESYLRPALVVLVLELRESLGSLGEVVGRLSVDTLVAEQLPHLVLAHGERGVVARFGKQGHGLPHVCLGVGVTAQTLLGRGHLGESDAHFGFVATCRVDDVGLSGVVEGLPVFAHGVMDFGSHAVLDGHTRRVVELPAVFQCLSDVFFTIVQLLCHEADAR